ncbi:MAG: hypothetical protein RLP02_19070 [Coleofasciculus sp. C2-GNP5-27]
MKTLVKWTVRDYHSLIETGILGNRQVELLQGELVEMPPGRLFRVIGNQSRYDCTPGIFYN